MTTAGPIRWTSAAILARRVGPACSVSAITLACRRKSYKSLKALCGIWFQVATEWRARATRQVLGGWSARRVEPQRDRVDAVALIRRRRITLTREHVAGVAVAISAHHLGTALPQGVVRAQDHRFRGRRIEE